MKPLNSTIKVANGVVSDVSDEDMPEGTAIASLNGRFLSIRDGKALQWIGVRGEKDIPINSALPSSYVIMGIEAFRGIIYALILDNNTDSYIYTFTPVYSDDKTIASFTSAEIIKDTDNLNLQLSVNYPLKKIKINFETNNVVTLYWNNGYNSIKSLRIYDGLSTTDLQNVDFAQKIKYGTLDFVDLVEGGLTGGAYFYAYRLIGSNGVQSDWSMAMGPIRMHNKKSQTSSWADYISVKYGKPDETTACGVELLATNIDVSYQKLQLVAIKSTLNGTFQEAYICLEETITSETMTLQHLSNNSFGSVPITDVQISTQSIDKVEDFDVVNNIMFLAGPSVKANLTEGEILKKNKIVGATLTYNSKDILFDNTLVTESTRTAGVGNVINPSLSSDEIIEISTFKNQTTLLFEKKTITIPSGFCGYKNPIVDALMRSGWRGETYRVGFLPVDKFGKRKGVRWLGDVGLPERGGNSASNPVVESGSYFKARVLSFVANNIDISEWVTTDGGGDAIDCEIQGFHIVVSPRDNKIQSEGILMSSSSYDDVDDVLQSKYGVTLANSYYYNTHPDAKTNGPKRTRNLYAYYSPDLFNDLIKNVSEDGFLQIEEQSNGQFTPYLPDNEGSTTGIASGYTQHGAEANFRGAPDGFTAWHWSNGWSGQNAQYKGHRIWQRFFKKLTTASGDSDNWAYARDPAQRQQNIVKAFYDIPRFNPFISHESQTYFLSELGNKEYINAFLGTVRQISPSGETKNAFASGSDVRLFITETIEDSSYDNNPYATLYSDGTTIVSHRKNLALPYGGQSDSALEKSTYRSCWHYQPIDLTVLSKIKKGDGSFVFDGVEVFAGDAAIVPFSLDRVNHGIGNESIMPGALYTDYYHSMASVIPLQSIVNTTLADGDRYEQDRALKVTTDDTQQNVNYVGIGGYKLENSFQYLKLERLGFTDLARVIYGQNLYYTLSSSIFFSNSFPTMFFWSLRKINAEEVDNFRMYPLENNQSIQGDFGAAVAIRSLNSEAIIFMQEGVLAIPVDERSAVTDQVGQTLSVGRAAGVGVAIPIGKANGLNHFFSLAQSNTQFSWFSFNSREWMYWAKGEQIVGLSKKFKFNFDFSEIFTNPNLITNNGINDVRIIFNDDGELIFIAKNGTNAFVFDILNRIYQGRRTINLDQNTSIDSLPVVVNPVAKNKLILPSYGDVLWSNSAGLDNELTIILNQESYTKKIFDAFELFGKNFEKIIFEDQDGNILEVIMFVSPGVVNPNIEAIYEDIRIFTSIPFTANYDYLRAYYIKMKLVGFKQQDIPVIFNSLNIKFRIDKQ